MPGRHGRIYAMETLLPGQLPPLISIGPFDETAHPHVAHICETWRRVFWKTPSPMLGEADHDSAMLLLGAWGAKAVPSGTLRGNARILLPAAVCTVLFQQPGSAKISLL